MLAPASLIVKAAAPSRCAAGVKEKRRPGSSVRTGAVSSCAILGRAPVYVDRPYAFAASPGFTRSRSSFDGLK